MKRLILCVSVAAITAMSYQYVIANEGNEESGIAGYAANVHDYINSVYAHIDFGTGRKPDSAVFGDAMYGYLNLLNAGKLDNPDILTICDFSKSSTEERMWVIDLTRQKVLINDLVAHGQGSGMEYATKFSNKPNSHQSSLGFYVTDDIYTGQHGKSLRLRGMDNGFNSAAYERDVVVHGAEYVSNNFIAGENRLGRSWGCPAVSKKIADTLIETIKGGSCLFIYYPSPKYRHTAYWLNKKPSLNTPAAYAQLAMLPKLVRDTAVIYETDALREMLTNKQL